MSNVTVKVKKMLTDLTSENDILTMTYSDGSQKSPGRISGYSAGELIEPQIEGREFVWKDVEFTEAGRVPFIKEFTITDVLSEVQNFGVFSEMVESDFIKVAMQDTKAFVVGDYLIPFAQMTATSVNDGYSSTGITVSTPHGVWSGRSAINLMVLGNSELLWAGGAGREVTIMYPSGLSVEGFIFRKIADRRNFEMHLEITRDGTNWEDFGTVYIGKPSENLTVKDHVDKEYDADFGWNKMDPSLPIRGIRISTDRTDNYVGLTTAIPVLNIMNATKLRTLTYENINFFDDEFKISYTDNEVVINRVGDTKELDSKNSSTTIGVRYNDEPQYPKISELVEFPKLTGLYDDLPNTLNHRYGNGYFKLPAGKYILDLEIEFYGYDPRHETSAQNAITNDTHDDGVIELIDAYSKMPMAPSFPIRGWSYRPNPSSMKVTDIPDTGTANLVISTETYGDTLYAGTGNAEGNANTLIFDFYTERKMTGVSFMSGYQHCAKGVKVELSTNGTEWQTVASGFDIPTTRYAFIKQEFNEVKTARYMRITNVGEPGREGTAIYGGYGRIFPVFKTELSDISQNSHRCRYEVMSNSELAFAFKQIYLTGCINSCKLQITKVDEYEPKLFKNSGFDKVQVRPNRVLYGSNQTPSVIEPVTFGIGADVNQTIRFDKTNAYSNTYLMSIHSPFRLWRKGKLSNASEAAKIKITDLDTEEDLSYKHLDLLTNSLEGYTEYSDKITSLSHIEYVDEQGTRLLITDGNLSNVFDGKRSTTFTFDSSNLDPAKDLNPMNIEINLSEPVEVYGVYETLSDHSSSNKRTPHGFRVYYKDDLGRWVRMATIDDTSYEELYRTRGEDGLRKFYRNNSSGTVTSDSFQISFDERPLADGESYTPTVLTDFGFYTSDGVEILKDVKHVEDIYPDPAEIVRFTDKLPPGNYKFEVLEDKRMDQAWYIEHYTGE